MIISTWLESVRARDKDDTRIMGIRRGAREGSEETYRDRTNAERWCRSSWTRSSQLSWAAFRTREKGGQIRAEATRRRVMENKYCRGVGEERGRSERKTEERERESEKARGRRALYSLSAAPDQQRPHYSTTTSRPCSPGLLSLSLGYCLSRPGGYVLDHVWFRCSASSSTAS